MRSSVCLVSESADWRSLGRVARSCPRWCQLRAGDRSGDRWCSRRRDAGEVPGGVHAQHVVSVTGRGNQGAGAVDQVRPVEGSARVLLAQMVGESGVGLLVWPDRVADRRRKCWLRWRLTWFVQVVGCPVTVGPDVSSVTDGRDGEPARMSRYGSSAVGRSASTPSTPPTSPTHSRKPPKASALLASMTWSDPADCRSCRWPK